MTRIRPVHALAAALLSIALPAAAQADAPATVAVADMGCPYGVEAAALASCDGHKAVKPQAGVQAQTITVLGSTQAVTASGRGAAPWHRSRGQVSAAPRR
jgi:hypothetical protein